MIISVVSAETFRSQQGVPNDEGIKRIFSLDIGHSNRKRD
jgi:hypothetical protein